MNTKELAKTLATYKAVTAKLEAECKTPEAAYEALKELGLTDSFEQFKQAAKELAAEAAKMSQEEIEAVVAAAAGYDVDEAEAGIREWGCLSPFIYAAKVLDCQIITNN